VIDVLTLQSYGEFARRWLPFLPQHQPLSPKLPPPASRQPLTPLISYQIKPLAGHTLGNSIAGREQFI